MPSAFPGMDPFLESPDWFPDLHDGLIFSIKQLLQSCLPSPYYARSRQRIWLDVEQRPPVEPDVDVLRAGAAGLGRARPAADAGSVAVAEPAITESVVVHVETMIGDPIEEPYIEIHRRQGTHDVVVAIVEILSRSNKTPGHHGRNLYLAEQQETLLSQVHLIELDLLRAGVHTTAVPLERALARAAPFDYHVCVHRSDRFADFFVYPITLEMKLPAIAVPLLSGDSDVALDLQLAFDRAYDAGPYLGAVRYDLAALDPPLPHARAEWVNAQLAAGAV